MALSLSHEDAAALPQRHFPRVGVGTIRTLDARQVRIPAQQRRLLEPLRRVAPHAGWYSQVPLLVESSRPGGARRLGAVDRLLPADELARVRVVELLADAGRCVAVRPDVTLKPTDFFPPPMHSGLRPFQKSRRLHLPLFIATVGRQESATVTSPSRPLLHSRAGEVSDLVVGGDRVDAILDRRALLALRDVVCATLL